MSADVNNSKRPQMSSSRHSYLKGKQPSAKLKSKLLAIKAKKALMETYSTGSDISEELVKIFCGYDRDDPVQLFTYRFISVK